MPVAVVPSLVVRDAVATVAYSHAPYDILRRDAHPLPCAAPHLLMRCSLLARTFVALVLPYAGAFAQSSGTPPDSAATARVVLRAGRATTPIRLDGGLDERAWSSSDSITTLTQTEPREGAPASARTVVRVIATEEALIIGVRAEQPDGVPVVSFARERDAPMGNEDHVRVVLDTYLDGRSGYVFAVNANGARYDGLVVDQGERESSDWDGIWEAAAVQSRDSWSVEMRIPLKTLLFRQELTEWGFNVQRRIQPLLETVRWSAPLRQFQLTHVNRAGLLTGLPQFQLGLGLSIPSLPRRQQRPCVAAGRAGHAR